MRMHGSFPVPDAERPPFSLSAGVPRTMVTSAGIALATLGIVTLVVLLGRLAWRYPLLCGTFLLTFYVTWFGGIGALIALVLFVVFVLLPWRRLNRRSFDRLLGNRLRSEGRRATNYGPRWRSTTLFSGLAQSFRGRVYYPKLTKIRSDLWRDFLYIKMLVGQSPTDYEARTDELAHSFAARSVRVWVDRPGRLVLEVVHIEPLAIPFDPLPLPNPTVLPDLTAVPVGVNESGGTYTLRVEENHLLVAGVMGAGKGSFSASLLCGMAAGIRCGAVQVYGIDPKGGMELRKTPDLFERLVCDNGFEAVDLLEDLAAKVRLRASQLADMGRRVWSWDSGLPFVVLVVDELADVIAYQPDRKLRERANLALQTICSQGRAPGVAVVGQLQDPRKEILSFRHLFPTRLALRLDEPAQVDMVLGVGVRERGAFAHEISALTPGVAWVKVDGRREPERVRAFHVTDAHLEQLNAYVAEGRRPNGIEVCHDQ